VIAHSGLRRGWVEVMEVNEHTRKARVRWMNVAYAAAEWVTFAHITTVDGAPNATLP
jgi:hypothetical protein